MGYVFDGATKVITLTSGTVSMDVRDLWSRWVDWFQTSDNSKWPLPFEQIGGEDISVSAGTKIPTYLFMQNGWKIKPQEANHTLKVSGGILVDSSGDPFISTTGAFVVRVVYEQPVQAITVATGGGGGGGFPSAAEIAAAVRAELTPELALIPAMV